MSSRDIIATMLHTEQVHPHHSELDRYPTPDLVRALIEDQALAARAVLAASETMALAVERAAARLRDGGRLVYVGAGTSGRLGLLDSVELYPTFSWPHERVTALMAGGAGAMKQAIEGAEDDRVQGGVDLAQAQVGPHDVVLLIAASGATPYTLGACEEARRRGALTIALANNPDSALVGAAEVGITLATGAELISGSTRLKAGTAQKIALNTFSSAVMVRLHKVYGNLMVDVMPTNAKLHRRCVRLTVLATGCDEATARSALETCRYRVKTAIVCIMRRLDTVDADALLAQHEGDVRAALAA